MELLHGYLPVSLLRHITYIRTREAKWGQLPLQLHRRQRALVVKPGSEHVSVSQHRPASPLAQKLTDVVLHILGLLAIRTALRGPSLAWCGT